MDDAKDRIKPINFSLICLNQDFQELLTERLDEALNLKRNTADAKILIIIFFIWEIAVYADVNCIINA